ncbi:MAG: hypothetical protein HKP61_12610 [Dactylosporangium sp.]|nr:hypothetical protein [Dactylosporangium sp.]NNJ61760.1 hypothetical protein [Dactylosporangium sp.]
MIVTVLAPISIVFVVLGEPLAVALFAWHRYTPAQAADTGMVIAIAGLCLIPYAIGQAQTFAFYALSDARTPALLNIPVVVLRIGVDLVLYMLLPVEWVAAAMMAGNGVSYLVAAIAAIAGWWLLRRRGLRGPGMATAPTTAKAILAATVAAIPAAGAAAGIGWRLGTGKPIAGAQLAAAGTLLLIGYLTASSLLRVSEVQRLLGIARRSVPGW